MAAVFLLALKTSGNDGCRVLMYDNVSVYKSGKGGGGQDLRSVEVKGHVLLI